MKMKLGRTGRQCWSLSPNCHHCYAGRENFQGCSGRNHWTTGCVCVSAEERNDKRNKTEYKKYGRNYSNDKHKNKPIKSTEGNEKKQLKTR